MAAFCIGNLLLPARSWVAVNARHQQRLLDHVYCVNQQTAYAGVMRLSEKYDVPQELALLYDFVNTLDRRRFVEQGVVHAGGDELATPREMESWMRRHGLLA